MNSNKTSVSTIVDRNPPVPRKDESALRDAGHLFVFEGKSARVFPLPRGGQVRVGRSDDVELRLEEARVSRLHARLLIDGGRVRLEDCGSQNGTFVNGEKLTGARLLGSGDAIAIAGNTLLFHGPRHARTAAQDESKEGSRIVTVGGTEVVIADPAMRRLYELIERLAHSDLPVLVTGETGTGKELVASALHHWSARAGKRMVSVNCAALPQTLLESELFGHEKGAFSGAVTAKVGLVEESNDGTLFLDEIGELPLQGQAKLLRVLDTQKLTRLGSTAERRVNLRVVAATNRDLEAEVKAGHFRQDLYFRLSAARLWIPSLRDRHAELPVLARRFLLAACRKLKRAPIELSASALRQLTEHRWPGNVRELQLLMDYAAASTRDNVVQETDLEERLRASARTESSGRLTDSPTFAPLEEELQTLERSRMKAALEATRGNKTHAAALIHMPLRTFLSKLKRYGDLRAQSAGSHD